jgi:hypothetical protein
MEFNADLLKISMTNDQYWDLMVLLDWLAAYDELRVCVALEKLSCCEISPDALPPHRMCGFRKRYADREPCGNFAMYSSRPMSIADNDCVAEGSCEFRCGVHIDQSTGNYGLNSQPCALFEKQDFTSFISQEDALGPSRPVSMIDTTEEQTAIMLANTIFQLCFADSANTNAAAASTAAVSSVQTLSSSTLPALSSTAASLSDTSASHQASIDESPLPRQLPEDKRTPPSLRHAQTELRAFMEHLGVQYCLITDCDVYGRPRPATHPLLSSYANSYLSDIVRCCCLSKKKESASQPSLRGAQRGKPFFGLVAQNLLGMCKEWLKNTTPQKGWLTYFTSWGKTELMSPSKVAPSSASRGAASGVGEDGTLALSVSLNSGMPADLYDPEDDRADCHNVASADGFNGVAWPQFCT